MAVVASEWVWLLLLLWSNGTRLYLLQPFNNLVSVPEALQGTCRPSELTGTIGISSSFQWAAEFSLPSIQMVIGGSLSMQINIKKSIMIYHISSILLETREFWLMHITWYIYIYIPFNTLWRWCYSKAHHDSRNQVLYDLIFCLSFAQWNLSYCCLRLYFASGL